MLYLDHDFYSNFNSGVSSGDNELLSDMIANEISELIVYKSDALYSLFKKVGIKLSEKASDEKIVDTILDNLQKNVKLVKGLAFLIAENNQASKAVKVVVGKDGNERRLPNNPRAAKVSEIDMVASGIQGIADSFKYKPQLKKEFKLKLMRTIKTKSEAVGDRKRKHTSSKNGKYWLYAFLIIGASVGAYFYLKHRKKTAAKGMEVGGETPSPKVVEPVAPTPPVVETTPPPAVQPMPQPAAPVQPAAPAPIAQPEIPTV